MKKLKLIKASSGIHIKKSHQGQFTEYCGGEVTQEKIDKAKQSRDPKIRKQAVFAENARKWKHKDGGSINFTKNQINQVQIDIPLQYFDLGGMFRDFKLNTANFANDTITKGQEKYKNLNDYIQSKSDGKENTGNLIKQGVSLVKDIKDTTTITKNQNLINKNLGTIGIAQKELQAGQMADAERANKEQSANENLKDQLNNFQGSDAVKDQLAKLHTDINLAGGSNATQAKGTIEALTAENQAAQSKIDVAQANITSRQKQQKAEKQAQAAQLAKEQEKKEQEDMLRRIFGSTQESTPDNTTLGNGEESKNNPNGANVQGQVPSQTSQINNGNPSGIQQKLPSDQNAPDVVDDLEEQKKLAVQEKGGTIKYYNKDTYQGTIKNIL